MSRVLFVLKNREAPYENETYGYGRQLQSGLYNSAKMVCKMLQYAGVDAKLVHVQDNNQIHREIVAFNATHVIIEAFWVVPEKFIELHSVCPDVKFIIRNHSETPFLANEGIAFDWTIKYVAIPNVFISCNAPRMLEETRTILREAYPDFTNEMIVSKTPYLPNYYMMGPGPEHQIGDNVLNVGCFGAVRPLKNHMMQAIAAIKVAGDLGRRLRFHINGTRIEMNGSPILKNLRQLFENLPNHELVEHPWMDHEDFKDLVQSMDMVTQCSFSETFNIVAADAVSQNVPVVVSKEIPWSSSLFQADPTSCDDIVSKMHRAFWVHKMFPAFNPNMEKLKAYNRRSKKIWLSYFK